MAAINLGTLDVITRERLKALLYSGSELGIDSRVHVHQLYQVLQRIQSAPTCRSIRRQTLT